MCTKSVTIWLKEKKKKTKEKKKDREADVVAVNKEKICFPEPVMSKKKESNMLVIKDLFLK